MERVLEELASLASHWDQRGVPSLSDVSGHDSQKDDQQRTDSSRQYPCHCLCLSVCLSVRLSVRPSCDVTSEDAVVSAAGRVTSRLERDSCTCVAAPELVTSRCPVPAVNHALLYDEENLLFALHSDFLALVDHARYVTVH